MGAPSRGPQDAGMGWFIFCVMGTISSLSLYGLCLEFVTSGGRKLHEASFIFITTLIYAITAYIARWIFSEEPTEISKYNMLFLSLTSIASTFASIRSLRYVIYPVQVLAKSCKPVPVMIFGTILGKTYSWQKYLNVVIITTGVALFMGGGKSSNKADAGANASIIGGIMLIISLSFDGATGAYEDKLMGTEHVGPFDLMYNIQFGKALMSFCVLIAVNQLDELLQTLQSGGFFMLVLGFTGAIGQVFVFLTISKFGALNCALIGLGRKIFSLALSFVMFGHALNVTQTIGLALSLIAMVANFFEKGGKKTSEVKTVHEVDASAEGFIDNESSRLLETNAAAEEERDQGSQETANASPPTLVTASNTTNKVFDNKV